jgi:SAM-dependent methyltransferase
MASGHHAKVERERDWYAEHGFRHDHPLNSRLFFSEERNAFAYAAARRRLASLLEPVGDLLIAPIGRGNDLPYLQPLARRLAGIDVSAEAVAFVCDPEIDARVGDMLELPYPDESFDAVAVPLFFHHYVTEGYDPYVREIARVLRPGGVLVTLEPSALHPVWWISWALRRVVGNISGTVEDERPIRAHGLIAAFQRVGFGDLHLEAAAFSHPRTPRPVARAVNCVTRPLARVPGVNQLAWTFVVRATKPA